MTPAWFDTRALKIARQFTADDEGQRRAQLQCAIVQAMGDAAPGADEAVMTMRQRAIRAHQICNLLRLAHPDIGELGDDGCLHEAIHDILRVESSEARRT